MVALPDNVAEARAARRLAEVIVAAGVPAPGYAVLLERLRGGEDEGILREAAAELMQQPFAEDIVDVEFEGVVERLLAAESKRVFSLLQEKVSKLGLAGLSGEEKQQYVQALNARGQPS
jgi:DNA primase